MFSLRCCCSTLFCSLRKYRAERQRGREAERQRTIDSCLLLKVASLLLLVARSPNSEGATAGRVGCNATRLASNDLIVGRLVALGYRSIDCTLSLLLLLLLASLFDAQAMEFWRSARFSKPTKKPDHTFAARPPDPVVPPATPPLHNFCPKSIKRDEQGGGILGTRNPPTVEIATHAQKFGTLHCLIATSQFRGI